MDLLLPLLLFLWARDDRDRRQAIPPALYPQPGPGGYPWPVSWGGAWYGPWTQTYPQPQPPPQPPPPPPPPSGGSGQAWPGVSQWTWGQPQGGSQPAGGQVPWVAQGQPPGPGPVGIWAQGGIGPVPWPGTGQGQPPTAGPARPWRRIREGDTGYGLAQRATGAGGRWRELLEVNPELTTYTDSKKQTQIKPWAVGQKIYLPPGWEKIADGIDPGVPIPAVPPGAVSESKKG